MPIDPFIKTPDYSGYHFFDGFHGLTEQGVPRFIQDKYEDSVTRAGAFVHNGMWRAIGKGIVKGVAYTALAALVVAGVVGIIGGQVGGTAGPLFSGVEGITNGISSALSGMASAIPTMGLPVLAAGAAFGAVYEVHHHRDSIQKDLMKTREMMQSIRGIARDQQIGKERAQIMHDFDPMGEVSNSQGLAEWKNRVAARQQQAAHDVQQDRMMLVDDHKRQQELDEINRLSAERPKEVEGWAAKEDVRRQQRFGDEEQGRNT